MSPVVKVIQPEGILDGVRGNQMRRDLAELSLESIDIVLIDLSEISFMDSSGLSALVSVQRTIRTGQGKLYLCGINEQVKMVFELTRMDRVFDTFANRSEFKKTFNVEI
jgi:anti-anti-sigma factor